MSDRDRNAPCKCGSLIKYKRCCWPGDQFPQAREADVKDAEVRARYASMSEAEREKRRREVSSVLAAVAGIGAG